MPQSHEQNEVCTRVSNTMYAWQLKSWSRLEYSAERCFDSLLQVAEEDTVWTAESLLSEVSAVSVPICTLKSMFDSVTETGGDKLVHSFVTIRGK
jgi:hypothetical protein